MNKITTFLSTIASTTLLAGCFLPEKFESSLKFNSNGSYSYKYEGKTAFIPAILQMQSKAGSLTAKEDADLKNQALQLAEKTDVKKAAYVGNGRYDLVIAGDRKQGQQTDVLGAFKVFTDKDGVINITSASVKQQDVDQLKKFGLKLDGKLEVTLPKNAEVISSNATSTPSFFGLFGTYAWSIGSIDTRPMMKIRLR